MFKVQNLGHCRAELLAGSYLRNFRNWRHAVMLPSSRSPISVCICRQGRTLKRFSLSACSLCCTLLTESRQEHLGWFCFLLLAFSQCLLLHLVTAGQQGFQLHCSSASFQKVSMHVYDEGLSGSNLDVKRIGMFKRAELRCLTSVLGTERAMDLL